MASVSRLKATNTRQVSNDENEIEPGTHEMYFNFTPKIVGSPDDADPSCLEPPTIATAAG